MINKKKRLTVGIIAIDTNFSADGPQKNTVGGFILLVQHWCGDHQNPLNPTYFISR